MCLSMYAIVSCSASVSMCIELRLPVCNVPPSAMVMHPRVLGQEALIRHPVPLYPWCLQPPSDCTKRLAPISRYALKLACCQTWSLQESRICSHLVSAPWLRSRYLHSSGSPPNIGTCLPCSIHLLSLFVIKLKCLLRCGCLLAAWPLIMSCSNLLSTTNLKHIRSYLIRG